MSRSVEQRRAAYAWKCVEKVDDDYAKRAKAAPALVMSNGLMQTLAFFQSKKEFAPLLTDILGWLKEQKIVPDDRFTAAIRQFHESNSEDYLFATQETLEILRWIRQLADAATKSPGGK